MKKIEYVLDNEGNEVTVGDKVIASINLWRGKEEVARGIVTRVSPATCTATYARYGSKRVKNTKFIRVEANRKVLA